MYRWWCSCFIMQNLVFWWQCSEYDEFHSVFKDNLIILLTAYETNFGNQDLYWNVVWYVIHFSTSVSEYIDNTQLLLIVECRKFVMSDELIFQSIQILILFTFLSSLELLLIDRKMKGPGWLDIKCPRKCYSTIIPSGFYFYEGKIHSPL